MFPVLAALPSVRHWSNVAVTEALHHCGTKPEAENMIPFERLAKPLALEIRMGLRNAFRKPQRTLLTAASLGIAPLLALLASIAPARPVNRQSVSAAIQSGT